MVTSDLKQSQIEVFQYLANTIEGLPETLSAVPSYMTVFVVFTPGVWFSDVILAASDKGLVTKGTAWIMYEADLPLPSQSSFLDPREQQVLQVAQGLLLLKNVVLDLKTPALRDFFERFQAKQKQQFGFDVTVPNQYHNTLYESVFLYAHVIGRALQTGADLRSGRSLAKLLPDVSFEVLGETVNVDDNLDAQKPYTIYNWVGFDFVKVGTFSHQRLEMAVPVLWPGNTSTVPVVIQYSLGFMIPSTGWNAYKKLYAAVPLAMDELKARNLTSFQLAPVFSDDSKCSAEGGLEALTKMLNKYSKVSVVIGPVKNTVFFFILCFIVIPTCDLSTVVCVE